jgi:hypothetical protein
MEKQFTKHKNYQMGTGVYRFVGIWAAPSKSLLEHNPNSYNCQMSTRPKCCHFTCDHCGTPITIHHIIKDTNNENFCVGSSCIEKLNNYELTTASKEAVKKRNRLIRKEKREAELQAKREAHEAELEIQRKNNNGLTDYELKQKQIQEHQKELESTYSDIAKPILIALKFSGGDFCRSIARNIIKYGDMPYGNAKNIVIDIMAKQFGRRNSKAYNEAYDQQVSIYEAIENKFSELNK